MKRLITIFVVAFSFSIANAQWVQMNGPTGAIFALAANGGYFFAGNSTGGVFLSEDEGFYWSLINIGLPRLNPVTAIIIKDASLFAGTFSSGVFLSMDSGATWTAANTGLTGLRISATAVHDGNVFVETDSGVNRSTDNGAHWIPANNGLMIDQGVAAFAVSGPYLFAGTGNGVYYSLDSGKSWNADGLTDTSISALTVNGINLFAGTKYGLARSTDNGVHWSFINREMVNDMNIIAFATNDSTLFAGTFGYGVFLSTDNGANWIPVNTELTDAYTTILIINNGFLFNGTEYSGIWRRPLSEMISSEGVNAGTDAIPATLQLTQNYPNPFSGTTTISYSLPVSGRATLTVYNALGEEVATLVNGESTAGEHAATFNAENLQNGMYFYRLTEGKYSQTGKMTVIK
jgi:hypothetical protein